MTELKEIAQLASEEFLRRGVRVFEVPAKQLFTHDASGELVVLQEAKYNRRMLASMALEFEECKQATSGVSLRRSLTLGDNGASLLYATGCKVMCAIQVEAGQPRMIALALIMTLRPQVLENSVLKAIRDVPPKALFLELICAQKDTGGATLLLLRLLAKLSTAAYADGILAHAVNKKSKALFQKHQYEALSPSVYRLTKQRALAKVHAYETQLLRSAERTRELCTRQGATAATARKTFWDCR